MAIITPQPTIMLVGTLSLVEIVPAPPVGYIDKVSLSASLITGTADGYAFVWMADSNNAQDNYVRWNEPIRYAVPGGNPDLLLDFMLHAGQSLQIAASSVSLINFTAWNRFRKQIA